MRRLQPLNYRRCRLLCQDMTGWAWFHQPLLPGLEVGGYILVAVAMTKILPVHQSLPLADPGQIVMFVLPLKTSATVRP